jgi:enamine deaminase RidA (YjgF/YER057c/UK114 family)
MARLDQAQYVNEAVEKQLGFAACVQSGKTLYLSGLVAIDENMQVVSPGDMGGQIDKIYDHIEAILGMHQATLQNVVNEMIFVTDLQALAAAAPVRVARYQRVPNCAFPASTAVQVSALFFPEAMIEVQITAALD